MNYRWNCFISFLAFLLLLVIAVVMSLKEISAELHISDLIKHGIYLDGVLIQELAGTSNAIHFKGEYEVGTKKYEFYISDGDKRLALHDSVTIIHDRKTPSDFIVKGYYQSSGLFAVTLGAILVLLVLIFLCLYLLYEFIKISKLYNSGKRILCEPVNYKPRWLFGASTSTIACKMPNGNSQIYKGVCYTNFESKMELNNLKYIPIYISQDDDSIYYVDCEEAELIIKRKNYKGHTIEELQGQS